MKIETILLTGDDGYNAPGIRVLVRFLKPRYEISIAATKDQQSGVGGMLSINNGKIKWGIEKVEGIDAVWVDGTPGDTIEFAHGYFNKKFDLVISGINWGENVGPALISSGTFCGAVRTLGVKLAKKAVVLSLSTSVENWHKEHSLDEEIKEFLDYPGKMAFDLIEMCIENNFYNSKIININFPASPTKEYRFTKVSDDIAKFYFYPVEINRKNKTFKYPDKAYTDEKVLDEKLDIGALNRGFISISPVNSFF